MPIINKIGDIFDDPEINVICHQANHWNTLLHRKSSGIASQIEKRYPAAADADSDSSGVNKVGTYSHATVAGEKIIINVYSQIERVTSYDAVAKVFTTLEAKLRLYNERFPRKAKTMAIPYGYGSNIAVGKFRVIEAILISIFGDSPVKLIIMRLPTQPDLE